MIWHKFDTVFSIMSSSARMRLPPFTVVLCVCGGFIMLVFNVSFRNASIRSNISVVMFLDTVSSRQLPNCVCGSGLKLMSSTRAIFSWLAIRKAFSTILDFCRIVPSVSLFN